MKVGAKKRVWSPKRGAKNGLPPNREVEVDGEGSGGALGDCKKVVVH